ncbi:hypothetical protein CGT96_14825 [Vibrio metoecus]|nr:hypothetical protein CGT97_07080 [Vibrio metoecus]PAR41978.1 hypothetical protein CGT96_14825 [Vibrio metoecus]
MFDEQCISVPMPYIVWLFAYESMIMVWVLFVAPKLILLCASYFSSIEGQSLTLSDIIRKLRLNLHASASNRLLIIDP